MYSWSHGKCPLAIFGLVDWERKRRDGPRFHLFLKSLPSCFLYSRARHLLQTAVGFLSSNFLFHRPFFCLLSSIVSPRCAQKTTENSMRANRLESDPILSLLSSSRFPSQNKIHFFLLQIKEIKLFFFRKENTEKSEDAKHQWNRWYFTSSDWLKEVINRFLLSTLMGF